MGRCIGMVFLPQDVWAVAVVQLENQGRLRFRRCRVTQEKQRNRSSFLRTSGLSLWLGGKTRDGSGSEGVV
ncbi:hypothetical protein NDU88_005779 [Pleurodeles waltl]|uniref:Uncharacterized protein n=1 Tax=Pleurodeles waltl TaxID=8319 RepID=A0AAV7TCL1_PLEWA|nr:hypothetical protein NDU88_005779 [Pleurodeles waltl]